MEYTNLQLLLVINFIHALCTGLIVPVLSPHIMQNGGNHILLGLLVAGAFTCQLLSKDFLALFHHGRKFTLTMSLFISFFTYTVLVFTSSYWIVLFSRLIYSLTNQVDTASKDFVARTEPQETHIKIFNLIDIMKTAGIVTGAISGGYIYAGDNNIVYNAMIASVLSLSSVLMLQQIDKDSEVQKQDNKFKALPGECYKQLNNVMALDYSERWSSIMLKTAYVASFTIFFTKYSLLIVHNYQVGTIVIGYTVAYQNMLIFACNCTVPFIREIYSSKAVFEHSLLVCSVTLMGLYYAPTYECYLILFIPMILTYTLVNSLLEDDALELKSKADLYQATNTITNTVNIIVPFFFGFVCEFFGARAFKILSLLPPAVCAFIIHQRFANPRRDESKED